jgi:hypothetical protein
MSFSLSVDAIVQRRAFDSELIVDEFPSAKHPPAAMGAVGILVQCRDGNVISIAHKCF